MLTMMTLPKKSDAQNHDSSSLFVDRGHMIKASFLEDLIDDINHNPFV